MNGVNEVVRSKVECAFQLLASICSQQTAMLTAAPNQMLMLLMLQLLLMQEVSGQCTAPLVCRPCANTGGSWVMDCGSAQLTAVPSFTSFPATLAVLSLRSNSIATLQDGVFLPQGGGLLKVTLLYGTSLYNFTSVSLMATCSSHIMFYSY